MTDAGADDIARTREIRREHVRRLAEVANLMLDAGMLLIVSAQELTQEDLELASDLSLAFMVLLERLALTSRADGLPIGRHERLEMTVAVAADVLEDRHVEWDPPPAGLWRPLYRSRQMSDGNAIRALKNAWNGAVATAERLNQLAPAVASIDEEAPVTPESLDELERAAMAHAIAAQALRGVLEALQPKADQAT